MLGLEGNDKIQEVTLEPTIQDAVIASKRESDLNVLCKDANGVQIIVEVLVSPERGFEKRAQYYAAKAYSRQFNKEKNLESSYQDLKAVVFIVICDKIIICDKTVCKDKKAYLSRHIILDKETYTQDLKDFSFTFIELPKFRIRKQDIHKLSNMVEKWCYFFKYADVTKEKAVSKIAGKDEILEKAYEEVNQFNWTEDELLFYEHEVKRVMDNSAAEKYVFNQGMEKGMERRNIEIVENMLAQGLDSSLIAQVTGLSLDTIKKLAH